MVQRGRGRGRGWVLANVYVMRLSGLEEKLACSFILAANMVRVGIQEFVKHADRL